MAKTLTSDEPRPDHNLLMAMMLAEKRITAGDLAGARAPVWEAQANRQSINDQDAQRAIDDLAGVLLRAIARGDQNEATGLIPEWGRLRDRVRASAAYALNDIDPPTLCDMAKTARDIFLKLPPEDALRGRELVDKLIDAGHPEASENRLQRDIIKPLRAYGLEKTENGYRIPPSKQPRD